MILEDKEPGSPSVILQYPVWCLAQSRCSRNICERDSCRQRQLLVDFSFSKSTNSILFLNPRSPDCPRALFSLTSVLAVNTVCLYCIYYNWIHGCISSRICKLLGIQGLCFIHFSLTFPQDTLADCLEYSRYSVKDYWIRTKKEGQSELLIFHWTPHYNSVPSLAE